MPSQRPRAGHSDVAAAHTHRGHQQGTPPTGSSWVEPYPSHPTRKQATSVFFPTDLLRVDRERVCGRGRNRGGDPDARPLLLQDREHSTDGVDPGDLVGCEIAERGADVRGRQHPAVGQHVLERGEEGDAFERVAQGDHAGMRVRVAIVHQ
jgi:hypothetical protein